MRTVHFWLQSAETPLQETSFLQTLRHACIAWAADGPIDSPLAPHAAIDTAKAYAADAQ